MKGASSQPRKRPFTTRDWSASSRTCTTNLTWLCSTPTAWAMCRRRSGCSLVALNAQRALKQEQPAATGQPPVQAEMNLETGKRTVPLAGTAASQPWPATLPTQVRAVADILYAGGTALTTADIEAKFKGRGPWKRSLPRILATLEALGRSRRDGDGWRAG